MPRKSRQSWSAAGCSHFNVFLALLTIPCKSIRNTLKGGHHTVRCPPFRVSPHLALTMPDHPIPSHNQAPDIPATSVRQSPGPLPISIAARWKTATPANASHNHGAPGCDGYSLPSPKNAHHSEYNVPLHRTKPDDCAVFPHRSTRTRFGHGHGPTPPALPGFSAIQQERDNGLAGCTTRE